MIAGKKLFAKSFWRWQETFRGLKVASTIYFWRSFNFFKGNLSKPSTNKTSADLFDAHQKQISRNSFFSHVFVSRSTTYFWRPLFRVPIRGSLRSEVLRPSTVMGQMGLMRDGSNRVTETDSPPPGSRGSTKAYRRLPLTHIYWLSLKPPPAVPRLRNDVNGDFSDIAVFSCVFA